MEKDHTFNIAYLLQEPEEPPEDPPIVVLLDRNRHYQQLVETLLHQVKQALENNQSEQVSEYRIH